MYNEVLCQVTLLILNFFYIILAVLTNININTMAALYKVTILMHALGSEAHASNMGIHASVARMWGFVGRNVKTRKG